MKEGLERVTVRLEVLTQDLHHVSHQAQQLSHQLQNLIADTERRFTEVNKRFEQVDRRFEQVDRRLASLEVGQEEMRAEIQRLDSRITEEARVLDLHIGQARDDLKKLIEDGHTALVSVLHQLLASR